MKEWIVRKFEDYFLKKDLSKNELQTQITVLKRILKIVVFFVIVNFIRLAVKVTKAKQLI